jgi:hypothetical protein
VTRHEDSKESAKWDKIFEPSLKRGLGKQIRYGKWRGHHHEDPEETTRWEAMKEQGL